MAFGKPQVDRKRVSLYIEADLLRNTDAPLTQSSSSILVLAACLLISGLAHAVDLPPGFVETRVVNGNAIPGMTGLSFANDGSLFLARTGPSEGMQIWILRPGGAPTLAHTFPLFPTGERGVHAVRVDPDHDTNARLWVYYTALDDVPIHNRLSHFTVVNDVLTNEVVVLDLPPLDATVHNGGCLVFDQQGRIFLGTGDDGGNSTTSQNPFDQRGKILHLNQDGSPAPDNMSLDGLTADPLVWATGLRNPFRCNMQPGLDNLFIADVGWFNHEELNIGIPGANYGWADIEGPEPAGQPGFVYPIYSYPHDGMGAAIIGGDHAEHQDFEDPAEHNEDNPYEGDYFYAEWAQKQIWRLELNESNEVVEAELFATNVDGLINAMEFGPDGSLYMAKYSVDSVSKITFIGGANRQPTAEATTLPASGPAPLAVTLDGTASSDPDDDPLNYLWDLGDATTSTLSVVNKNYPQGVYEAELTVDDGNGLSDTSPKLRIVSGNNAPVPTIDAPLAGTMYDAGQLISYSGTANDGEEGPIPCAQMSWQVIFHHANHTHPYLGPLQGSCLGQFTIADIGEDSIDTWYEIRYGAQDTGLPIGANGTLEGAQSRLIFPNLTSLQLETTPNPNLEVAIDTIPSQAPASIDSVVGFQRTLSTPEAQLGADGHTYQWLSWSNGQSREHTLAAPALPTLYTADFGCNVIEPIQLSIEPVNQGPNGRLQLEWTPVVSDPCAAGAQVTYDVWASDTATPQTGSGDFPNDPPYTLLHTTTGLNRNINLPVTFQYFLVSARGTDQLPGHHTHYGQ